MYAEAINEVSEGTYLSLIHIFLRMKKNKIMKDYWRVCGMALLLVALFFGSCSDDNDSNGDSDNAAVDPNIPVQVSGINPTTGGFGPVSYTHLSITASTSKCRYSTLWC